MYLGNMHKGRGVAGLHVGAAAQHKLQSNGCVRSCFLWLQVSRTHTFGRIGTHTARFYDKHHTVMLLSDRPVVWTSFNLDHLLQDAYTTR